MTHAIRFHKTAGPAGGGWRKSAVGEAGPREGRRRDNAVGVNFVDS